MIRAIRMVNCQSWEDNTIELSQDKVNVFIAENSTGKSVFFKMLKLTVCKNVYNADERNRLIRRGKTFAAIMFLFDDGSVGITRIYSNRVLYSYSDDGKSFLDSYDPIPIVISKLGILVNDKSNFIANIIDMDQSLLLVDSDKNENYELVKLLVTNNNLELLNEKLTNNTSKFKTYYSELMFKSQDLERHLEKYTYCDIDKLQYSIEKSEKMYNLFCIFTDMYSKLNYLSDNIMEDPGYDNLIQTIDLYLKINSILSLLNNIKILTDIDENVIECCNKLLQFKTLFNKLNIVETVDFTESEHKISVISKLEDILNCISRITILENIDYQYCTNLFNLISKLVKYSNKVKEIKNGEEYKSKLSETIDELELKLESFSDVIDGCPIYGKVLYKNGKCISNSDGLS